MYRFARRLLHVMATGGDRPTGKRRRVVTSFISNDEGAYLLVKRSQEVGSYQGYWGGVSGGIEEGEEDPFQRAVTEIEEEVGYSFTQLCDASSDLTFIRRGRPLLVDDGETRKFCIYPFLFHLSESGLPKKPRLNWENVDARFFTRTEFEKVKKVPLLTKTLDRVALLDRNQADALRRLEGDRDHGAAQLGLMALDELEKGGCLRFAAEPTAAMEHTLDFAWHLACCRPSMAAVGNVIASSMARFVNFMNKKDSYGIETVESSLKEAIQAERDSINAASNALLKNAMNHVDVVVCGADSLTLNGFVNKVGSTMLALLCKRHDIPLLVLSDTLKCTAGSINDIIYFSHIRTDRATQLEEKDGHEITDSWCQAGILPSSACSENQLQAMNLHVRNVYFEETPYNLCRCTIITEKGILDQESLREIICKNSEDYRTAFCSFENAHSFFD
eukprot:jgi/Picsp_1/5896/NSC_03253-R1_initiation factor 2b related protein